jgi:hypothetical protein
MASGTTEPLRVLCERAAARCRQHAGGDLDVDVLMVDFDGDAVVARA